MKLGELPTFFADILETLKLKRWDNVFAFDNIPANIIDRAFHITIGQASGSTANNRVHTFKVPVAIRTFFKGYRDPNIALSDGLNKANEIYAAILPESVRLTQASGLKDIRPVSLQPFQISQTNDNIVIVEMVFECVLIYQF